MHFNIALVTLHAGFSHSSLALRYLQAACRDEPFFDAIRLLEPTIKADIAALADTVTAGLPTLVGLSTYIWNRPQTLTLARAIKARRPETVIVLGGPEAGPQAESLLSTEPAIDYVVDGEGELAFRDLARWLSGGKGGPAEIAGLAWRTAVGVRRNPVQPVPVELLPSPLLLGLVDDSKPLVYWETSRGCPFRCTFCTSAGDRLRQFPEARTDAELARLAQLEHKTIKLLDRSFHLGTARTLRLLCRFVETPASLRFHLELNPDRISAEALALFAEAPPGKFQFEIGLQTLEAPVLMQIDRQMDVAKGLAAIERLVALRRHPVHLDLIAGLPGEDEAHCRTDFDRVFALYADHFQFGTLKLLPGTPLRAQAEQFAYRFDPEPPYEVRSHRDLPAAAFARLKAYGELTERLWNSGLVRHTLAHLVEAHFGRASALFDELLAKAPELLERPSPEGVFAALATLLRSRLAADPALRELLAWDYGHFALPGQNAPAEVTDGLDWQVLTIDGSRKRLPVFPVSAAAAAVINRLRREPVAVGRYGLWPRKHLRGRPVTMVAV